MNFLKSGLQSVLGAQEPGAQPSGAETVERLVDRVSSSTLLDDRRDACRALKSLSRKYRVEVGAQGMPALLQVLEMDKTDNEIIGYALDTLCNIMSQEQFDDEVDNPNITVNIGEQFTEMFIKNAENVTLTLNFLEEYDFRVRWSTIKLMTYLVANRTKEIQEIVLISPMAVSRLMDLLIDSREVIRNDAVLLLIQLTKGNANIQKIVAFENAFDRLFDVMKDEGGSDGGIVVEDCLILMLNLLKNNSSNQQFFKEGSYIQRLAPMFLLPDDLEETSMTPQKVSNIHCILQIVRALVSPNNSQQIVASCQKTMRSSGVLEALCNILMGSGIPPDILTETINTVAEVIRGDINNQEYFSSVLAPSNPPRPAIVVLLMSMINEKQPLFLRCSVLYCFECFLYRNEVGQTKLIQTLFPSSTDATSVTTGQLLCGGLFSNDTLSNWYSSVSLMYALLENPLQKEQLLRVLLATSMDSPPVTLLQQCVLLLQQQKNSKLQSKLGLLMLLSVWLSNCPMAVKTFLTTNGSVSFLMTQITANEHDDNEYLVQGLCSFLLGICIQFNDNSIENNRREDLLQLVVKRIGLELYNTKLGDVSKHESYSKSAKQPQIRVKASNELLMDYEFCKLFKALESIISKTVNGFSNGSASMTELTLSQEASGLVGQYKDIIREQDIRMKQLQDRMKNFEAEHVAMQSQLNDANVNNAQLSDQNILLRAQLKATTELVQQTQQNHNNINNNVNPANYTDDVQNQMALMSLNQEQQCRLTAVETENNMLRNEFENLKLLLEQSKEESAKNLTECEKLRKDQEDLLELLSDQEIQMNELKGKLKELGHPVDISDAENDEDVVNLQ